MKPGGMLYLIIAGFKQGNKVCSLVQVRLIKVLSWGLSKNSIRVSGRLKNEKKN
jgi:hypothetical protein